MPTMRFPQRVIILFVALCASFGLVGSGATATGVGRRAGAVPYEVYTGPVAGFYEVPSPLPAGAPGALIRVQDISSDGVRVTKRIMYHSVDGAGRDRAVTGKVTYPVAAAPPGGRVVMSIANGTVGLASKCALSRGGGAIHAYGLDAVSVASDYIGMGPIGEIQAYLSRASEGHSVVDAVRAARNLEGTGAGDRFVVLGNSQGGHGALATNELAAGYAPELDLLGTVAMAPAAVFDKTYGPLDELVTRVVGAMGVVALATEHPEIDLADILGPAAMAALPTIRGGCTNEITTAVLGIPFDEFYVHDPATTEPAHSIRTANDVGFVAAPSPVLLMQGTADNTVNPLRTDDLFTRMCEAGQVVQYRKIDGADHGNVYAIDHAFIDGWLADRVAGREASSNCTVAPTTTTTTSTTPPASTTLPADPSSTTAPSGLVGTPTTAAVRHEAAGNTVAEPVAATTDPGSQPEGALARTGAPSALAVLFGLLCVAAGTTTVVVVGRRR